MLLRQQHIYYHIRKHNVEFVVKKISSNIICLGTLGAQHFDNVIHHLHVQPKREE